MTNKCNNISIKELIDLFIKTRSTVVKKNTLTNYHNKMRYLDILYDIKVKNFNIHIYEEWKCYVNEKVTSLYYKNDIYKFLKSILNFGTKWYNIDFTNVYKNMTNFKDPNVLQNEMKFFTHEQFNKFLSYEEDLKYKTIFQIFYYCGLRIGELRALTWKDINFDEKIISITKQITACSSCNNWVFTAPKTNKSIRFLPLSDKILKNLLLLKKQQMKNKNYNDNWFIAGNEIPIAANTLREHKNKICKLANLEQIRIHDFRHSCASLLIHKGADVYMVARYLGHSKIEETLNTYSHLYSKESLKNIVSIMDQL